MKKFKSLQQLMTSVEKLSVKETQFLRGGEERKKHCRKKYEKRGDRWVCYKEWH